MFLYGSPKRARQKMRIWITIWLPLDLGVATQGSFKDSYSFSFKGYYEGLLRELSIGAARRVTVRAAQKGFLQVTVSEV